MHLTTENPPRIYNGIPTFASGDPKTSFRNQDAKHILTQHGYPKTLLGGSAKVNKSAGIGVLGRVLYLTPGLFCPASTAACRAGCLGHTSGRMQQPGPTIARDKRAAFYLEHQSLFLEQLKDELTEFSQRAAKSNAIPAVRLNGTSDIAWERIHPEVMQEFPQVQFYDYTKIKVRMSNYLANRVGNHAWPRNYHLTFSGNADQPKVAQSILAAGGNVAMVFWPELPSSWWGDEVIDGDLHDARFVDTPGRIVGLRAKGIARVDLAGFVARPCPKCQPESVELQRTLTTEDTHRVVEHRCPKCHYQTQSRWMLPHALKQQSTCRNAATSEPLQLRLIA